jgi:hypothetical protein
MERYSELLRVSKTENCTPIVQYDLTFVDPESDFEKLLTRLSPSIPSVEATRSFSEFRPFLAALRHVEEPLIPLQTVLEYARASELSDDAIAFVEVFLRATSFPELVPVARFIEAFTGI